MKFYIIIFFLVIHTNIFANEFNLSDISKNHKNQNYGSAIHQTTFLLKDSFENILTKSYKYLPYTRNIIKSNQTYSLSMYNNIVDFNTLIEYYFNYDAKHQVKLSLLYTLEEVLYYKNHIEHAHFLKDQQNTIVELQDSTLGSFFWNDEESMVYYVHSFSQNSPNDKISGLLLKIQFKKNTLYDLNIDKIVNQIIKGVQWNQLQKLYIIDN